VNSSLKKPLLKKVGLTLLFYSLAATSIYLLNKAEPSGPCTPGLGIMLLLLLPFISAVLFVVNSIKTYKGSKSNMLSAVIHLLVVIGFIVFLETN
jgi:hypothetical protein